MFKYINFLYYIKLISIIINMYFYNVFLFNLYSIVFILSIYKLLSLLINKLCSRKTNKQIQYHHNPNLLYFLFLTILALIKHVF